MAGIIVTYGLYSLYFFNENSGWICGDSGKLLKTTDGGISFSGEISGSEKYISDIVFINDLTGWYSSGEKKIFKTTNGGGEWFVPHQETFSAGVGAVQFVNSDIGLAFTYDNKILNSSDGGTTWNETQMAQGNYLNNILNLSLC